MCGADSFADGSCLPLDASSDAIGNPLLNFIVGNSAGSGAALLLSQAGVDRCTCGQARQGGGQCCLAVQGLGLRVEG